MTIYEADVPGVGKKFELELGNDERLVVIIHHDGKREVLRRPDEDADAERLFTLSGDTARKFGSIMEGAYFQPVDLDDTQVPLGDSFIEWVDVMSDSPVVGETLHEADIRQRAGPSVIAIQRGEKTLSNPQPNTTIEADDILVTIGSREEHAALDELVEPDEPEDSDEDAEAPEDK